MLSGFKDAQAMTDTRWRCRHNYAIFAYWLAGSLAFYLLFSLPMGYLKHSQLDYVNTEQMK